MIKFKLLVLIFLLSCSSLSDKKYQINTIEQSGDKLLQFADNMRINKKYDNAIAYYEKASELYLLKNEKKKYLTSLSRIAIVYLKMNELGKYDITMKSIKDFMDIETINFSRQYDYIRAKRLEFDKKNSEAITIYLNISKKIENIERKTFYEFQAYKLMDTMTKAFIENSKESIESLDDLYKDGEIAFIELYSSCKFINAKISVKHKLPNTEKKIREIENLYSALEYSVKLLDVYDLYVTYYTNQNDIIKSDYYKKKADQLLNLNKNYLN